MGSSKIKPQKSISTIAGRQNGAVRLEDSVAVFNASSGRWDLLTLSKNSDAQLTSTANGFEIEDDGKFYTYSSRWTSPNDPDFEESEVTYVIRNIPASRMIAALDPWTRSMNESGIYISWQTTGQGLEIRTDRKSWMKIAEAKIRELDVNDETGPPPPEAKQRVGLFSRRVSTAQPIQPRVNQTEQKSLDLAKELRKGNVSDAQRSELRKLVTQSLDNRLREQEAQVRQLREKLSKVEQTLTERRQARNRMVERRVEELLDPNVDWDNLAPTRNTRQSSFNQPQKPTPIGIPGPPHIPMNNPLVSVRPTTKSSTKNPFANNTQPASANPNPSQIVNTSQSPKSGAEIVRELINRRRFAELSAKPIRDMQRRLSEMESGADLVGDALTHHTETVRSTKDEIVRQQKNLLNALAEWKTNWRDYEGQVRIAANAVEKSERLLRFADAALEQSRKLHERGLQSSAEMMAAEKEAELAKFDLLQMRERLQILSSVQKDSPHLNPDDFKTKSLLSVPETESPDPAKYEPKLPKIQRTRFTPLPNANL